VIRATVHGLDAALEKRVGPEYLAHTRATLAALTEGDETGA
jgi:hypothetical protein